MTLEKYLQKRNRTLTDLADAVGVSLGYISYIKDGKRRPSPQVALRIETATNGEVSRMELLYPR